MTTTPSSKSHTSEKNATRSVKTPNAIALLKSDHRNVENLFEEYEHARGADRKQIIAQQICEELTVHAQLEEQAFYPEARKALGNKEGDLIDEATVEHSSLKWLIAQLESESTDSALYDAKVTVLKEYVQHHVKEEESEIFPKLRKTDLDIDALGQVLMETKEKLQKKLLAKH